MRLRYTGLAGSADSLALAELAQSGRQLVVLTAGAADAQRLVQELPYFAPALRLTTLV